MSPFFPKPHHLSESLIKWNNPQARQICQIWRENRVPRDAMNELLKIFSDPHFQPHLCPTSVYYLAQLDSLVQPDAVAFVLSLTNGHTFMTL